MEVKKQTRAIACEVFGCKSRSQIITGNTRFPHTCTNLCEKHGKELYKGLSEFYGSIPENVEPQENKEIDKLAGFIMTNYSNEPGKETSESAVDVAIRLLSQPQSNTEAAEIEETDPIIYQLKKPTLTSIAKDLGIDIDRTDTKEILIEKIQGVGE